MKKNLIPMLLITAVFGTAHAAETAGVEFFQQPGAGGQDVTPYFAWTQINRKPTAGGTELKTTGFGLGAKYQYGFTEAHAIEVGLQYSNLETDIGGGTKPKSTGIEDIALSYKGTAPLAFGNLRFGADSTLGLTKRKNETNGDSNRMTGSIGVAPYVGADLAAGPGIFGGKLSYELIKTDATTENAAGVESKEKGGNDLTAVVFYELPISDMLLGLDVSFVSTSKAETDGVETNASYSTTGFDFYSRIPLMDNAVLLPKLTYAMAKDVGTGASKTDDNTLAIQVGARFAF